MSLASQVAAGFAQVAAEIKKLRSEDRSYAIPVGWWAMPQNILATAAIAQTSGQAGFQMIDLPAGTYDQLALSVAVAQSGGTTTTTLALYPSDPTSGLPDTTAAPLLQGTVTLTATGVRTTASAPVALKAGRYWTCHLYVQTAAPGTQATVHCNANNVEQPPGASFRLPQNFRGWARTGLTALPANATTTANIAAAAAATVAYVGVHRSA